jgi:hypothetical protein
MGSIRFLLMLIVASVVVSGTSTAGEVGAKQQEIIEKCISASLKSTLAADSANVGHVNSYMENLSEGKGYLAFGLFGKEYMDGNDLKKNFALPKGKELGVPVFTHDDYKWTGVISANSPAGFSISHIDIAIKTAMKNFPGEKVILFNLDGLDLERAMRSDSNGSEIAGYAGTNYTGAEFKLIMNNIDYFNSTRWYLGGTQLSPDQVRQLLGPLMHARP